MRRRHFVIAGGAFAVTLPFPARSSARGRIVYLRSGSAPSSFEQAFILGLRDLGYVDGRDFALEFFTVTADKVESTVEMLRGGAHDILVAAGTPAVIVAMRAAGDRAIIFVSSDPIHLNLVSNYARPGSRMTGLSLVSPELNRKRLELLKDLVPTLSKVGILFSATNPAGRSTMELARQAASELRLDVALVPVARGGFEAGIAEARAADAGAALVLSQGQTLSADGRYGSAVRYKMPTAFTSGGFVKGGGLMSFGPDVMEVYRRLAYYATQILKGASPTDLPVELPTKFEFVLNLKTARDLEIEVPAHLHVFADEVIE